jgi:hypothetical protein
MNAGKNKMIYKKQAASNALGGSFSRKYRLSAENAFNNAFT